MKKLLLLPLLLLITSCLQEDIVYGKGTLTTITRAVPSYSGTIIYDLDIPVTINTGTASVSVTTDTNLIEYILIDTTNGVINIHQDSTYILDYSGLSVLLTVPYTDTVICKNGNVTSTHTLIDTSVIRCSGNSSFSAPYIDADTVVLQILDSASISLEGFSDATLLHLTSDKDQMLMEFTTDHAYLDISRNKTTTFNVSSWIGGLLRGSGDFQILYSTPINFVELLGDGEVLYPHPDSIRTHLE